MKQQLNIELSCTLNESLDTHYLVYKIVNNINGKHYFGQHKTTNVFDCYFGSGKLIKQAITKYGLSAFTKIILYDFNNFDEMNKKEMELIPLSSCYPYDKMSYNLIEGGYNGQFTDNIKELFCGKNNPMYGKNFEDYMDEEAIKRRRQKLRENQLGTKRMINLDISPHIINVKLEDVNNYLKNGYSFYKFKIPRRNIPLNKYAIYHNKYWIETPQMLEEYFKNMGGYIVPNIYAHTFLRCQSSKLDLHNDGIHYNRIRKVDNKLLTNMVILCFDYKQQALTAIQNKHKAFGIDKIMQNFCKKENLHCNKTNIAISFIQKLHSINKNGSLSILTNQKQDLNKAILILTLENQKISKLNCELAAKIQMYLALAKYLRTIMLYIRIKRYKLRYHSSQTKGYLSEIDI